MGTELPDGVHPGALKRVSGDCSGELGQNKILVKPMKNSKISKLLAKKNMSHWFGGEVTDGKTSFEVLFGFYMAPARMPLSNKDKISRKEKTNKKP